MYACPAEMLFYKGHVY